MFSTLKRRIVKHCNYILSKFYNKYLIYTNEFDKDNSYVRCAIWGKKASRFFYEVNEEKDIFIEGSGLNKQLRNINGLNNYVFTVNCENYQILT